MEVKGIDVSSYQGCINWQQVAAAGYQFAILRTVLRNGKTDPTFEANYNNARAAGLKVSCYMFSYALSPAQATQEAIALLKLLDSRPMDMPVWVDMEWSEQRKIGRATVTEIALAFCRTLTDNSRCAAGIYCNTDWYKNVLIPAKLPYDFWIASYGNNTGQPGTKPDVPNMAAWQYTSKGSVPGVPGGVDVSIMYKEYWPEPVPAKLSGWRDEADGRRFYLGNTGDCVRNAWYKDADRWYWFDGAGRMVHDVWYQYKGDWYYLGADGAMCTGLQDINGKWYYLDQNGKMATDPITLTPGNDGALKWSGLAE